MFCFCRLSHFPWREHKLANDTALAMRGKHQILCLAIIHSLPGNIPEPCKLLQCVMLPVGQSSLAQAVGFKYAHCSNEFDTRHAMDCHRRKQSSLGTGCADPSNSKSVSFSSSIVREHDFLGAHPNHTEAVYVHQWARIY